MLGLPRKRLWWRKRLKNEWMEDNDDDGYPVDEPLAAGAPRARRDPLQRKSERSADPHRLRPIRHGHVVTNFS